MIRVVDEAPGTPGTPDRVQAATRRRLRRIVALAQRDRDARDAPVHDLVGLTSEIPTGAAVTIDFTAAAELGRSPNFKEGVNAFLEKRTPRWR